MRASNCVLPASITSEFLARSLPACGLPKARSPTRRSPSWPKKAFAGLEPMKASSPAGEIPATPGIFPASWINANFDVWIGHAEDVAAWELLWDAREAYARAFEARKQGRTDAPPETALKEARESLLAAEGSDWRWWFGPEHSTANDP